MLEEVEVGSRKRHLMHGLWDLEGFQEEAGSKLKTDKMSQTKDCGLGQE